MYSLKRSRTHQHTKEFNVGAKACNGTDKIATACLIDMHTGNETYPRERSVFS